MLLVFEIRNFEVRKSMEEEFVLILIDSSSLLLSSEKNGDEK